MPVATSALIIIGGLVIVGRSLVLLSITSAFVREPTSRCTLGQANGSFSGDGWRNSTGTPASAGNQVSMTR